MKETRFSTSNITKRIDEISGLVTDSLPAKLASQLNRELGAIADDIRTVYTWTTSGMTYGKSSLKHVGQLPTTTLPKIAILRQKVASLCASKNLSDNYSFCVNGSQAAILSELKRNEHYIESMPPEVYDLYSVPDWDSLVPVSAVRR